MAGRASFLPFLLILLLVAQVGCVKGGAQPLQIWHCYNNDSAVGPGSVRPIWIDPTDWKVGHIQTPNFPSPFPLPLECLWIFNNTRLLRNSRNQLQKYLHFYFTQFYLDDNILTVTSLNTIWPLKSSKILNWTDVDSIGTWSNAKQMQSSRDDTYILLRLQIRSKSYDNLHKRVLEVSDVYGFNITYESLPSPSERSDVCTLGLCNYNGECFLNYNSTSKHVGDFFCRCAYPKFAPTRNKLFQGNRCQYHTDNEECTKDINPCQNGGMCRYQSSRYIDCKCLNGFEGSLCEKKLKTRPTPSSTSSYDICPRYFAQVEVDPEKLAKVFSTIKTFVLPKLMRKEGRIRLFKRFGPNKTTGGVISFRWDHDNVTSERIEALQAALQLIDPSEHRLAATELANKKIKVSTFCAQKKVVVTPERGNSSVILQGDLFTLSCMVSGATKPIFVWYKNDVYNINQTIAQRYYTCGTQNVTTVI
jgi:hypothetical protein